MLPAHGPRRSAATRSYSVRLEPGDRERMREMLAEPEVAERWLGTNTLERLVDELYDAKEHVPFAILAGDEVIGYIQYSEETDADYRHAGIDMFLGTAWHGRGLGRDALRALVRHLIRDRGHHRITIDPAASNERAIRAYRAVGFRDVGRDARLRARPRRNLARRPVDGPARATSLTEGTR